MVPGSSKGVSLPMYEAREFFNSWFWFCEYLDSDASQSRFTPSDDDAPSSEEELLSGECVSIIAVHSTNHS